MMSYGFMRLVGWLNVCKLCGRLVHPEAYRGPFDAETQRYTPCGIVCDYQGDSCGDRAVIIAPAY